MSEVAKIPGLLLRERTYYSRISVPKDLVANFGRSQIWESLGTDDRASAEVLHLQKATHWKAAFIQVRRSKPASPEPANEQSSGPKPIVLSKRDVDALARQFFQHAKADLEDRETSPAELTIAERQHVSNDLHQQLSALHDWRHPDCHSWVGDAQRRALSSAGVDGPIDAVAHGRLTDLLRRALIQLCSIELARTGGDYRDLITDDFFNQFGSYDREHFQVQLGGQGLSLADAIRRFQKEHLELKLVTEKTATKHKSLLGHIQAFFGSDMLIRNVTRADCNRFRDTLAKLPPNFTKRGSAQADLTAIAEANQGPTLAWETQNNYLRMLTDLFEWAVRERLVRDNVAQKIAPLRKRQAAEEQRLPFDKRELVSMFSAPLYIGCLDDERGFATPGPNLPRRSRYWLPLIALFSGMRMGEILQLSPDHIRRSEAGTDFFVLTRDMKLKTQSAEREVPVHPELKRMGFLEWVSERRDAEADLLFDDVPESKFGYRSDMFTKRFATFLRSIKLPSDRKQRLSFHSFRHTFKDALNETGAPEEIKDEICGWSRTKQTGRRYGSGLSADLLQSYVHTLSFDLNLSHLYVPVRHMVA